MPPRTAARPRQAQPAGHSGGGVIPFTSAAHEHTEGPFYDNTFVPSTAVQNFGPVNVPSYGFLRHIWILVNVVGGTIGAGTLSPDYPFSIFSSLSLIDTNGAPLFGPLDGYATFWANVIGAYANKSDPRSAANWPDYVGTLNATFAMRLPIEISHHDALGSLANQNSAASYQVQGAINPSTFLWNAPTTPPTGIRVRLVLEAWSLPNEVDRAGRPQSQLPPAHGTTQYWSQQTPKIAAGQNTTPITRTGNLIRNWIFITRSTVAVTNFPNVFTRDNTVFPDPMTFQWDARMLLNDSQSYRKGIVAERANLTALDTGVFALTFNHSTENNIGDDNPSLWIPSVQASRFEVDGVSATTGNMQIITNDIAPGEVVPSERYVEPSATGFHPEVGVTTPGTM